MAAAIDRGLGTVEAPEVDLYWSTNFVAKVQHLIGSKQYSIKRGSGTVAAKTMRTETGPVIVFNAAVVDVDAASDQTLSLLERTAAHEGVHAKQRLVDMQRAVPNRQFGDYELWGIGLQAIEEYVTEREVLRAGYPPSSWSDAGEFPRLLEDLDIGLVLATISDDSARDPAIFANTVLETYCTAVVGLAYVAAAVLEGKDPGPSLTGADRAAWEGGLGSSWDARLELYRRIDPGPLVPDDPELLLMASELERATLANLGFEFKDGGFWRTCSDQEMSVRLDRAVAANERRPVLPAP